MQSNFAAATATEVRIGEVEIELNRLCEQRQELDGRLQELEKRLNPILATRPETGQADSKGQPEPVRVPLAQSIHDQVFNLSQMNDHLQSVLNRIEL